MKILIVCTGNSCRSPMAEAFLKKHLRPKDDFEIISAGTLRLSGTHATQEAIEVMKEEGIDISSHLSRALSDDIIKSADIILAMADVHRQHILERDPSAERKIHLFKEFAEIADTDKGVVDPIGQSIDVYKRVKDEIKKATIKIVRKIKGEVQ